MFKTAAAFVLALLGSAQAHYYVTNINGQSNCLRPLVLYNENFPVTGNDISSSKITCGANPASANPASSRCTYAAGSTINAQYSESSAWHIGPCYVYISQDGRNWAKIYEDSKKINGEWCDSRFRANDRTLSFRIPSELPSGNWIVRIEHIALHQANTVGGAQIYVRCADITVTGGGSTAPSPLTQVSVQR
ncbi:hypothetical protein HDV00_012670 [Rhizophlyctis rosea]|nr:hypothetical protein HDV00_012670 [Rhizophlyctis rosea]